MGYLIVSAIRGSTRDSPSIDGNEKDFDIDRAGQCSPTNKTAAAVGLNQHVIQSKRCILYTSRRQVNEYGKSKTIFTRMCVCHSQIAINLRKIKTNTIVDVGENASKNNCRLAGTELP